MFFAEGGSIQKVRLFFKDFDGAIKEIPQHKMSLTRNEALQLFDDANDEVEDKVRVTPAAREAFAELRAAKSSSATDPEPSRNLPLETAGSMFRGSSAMPVLKQEQGLDWQAGRQHIQSQEANRWT